MSCERWQEALAGRIYGENDPADDRALESHLESCRACRAALDGLQRVRVLLRENEPEVERPPRVVVLRDTPRFRPALLAASLVGAALLAGVGAGAGYAVGHRGAPAPGPAVATAPTAAEIDAMVQKQVDARLAAFQATMKPETQPATAPGVTHDDMKTELAKFERRLDNKYAAAYDDLAGQIEASEVRTGARIGQTNQALRYVALASNPNVTER
ncbi:MAG TPA: zf-HC2 domain-containing protein [Candidatus Polarisedimenticolaceae bacterium]|nr:zf-HC2 domain-containing protein [Candidatus Polarisedimenticolaceae bacterium]